MRIKGPVFWIVLSLLFVSGPACSGYLYMRYRIQRWAEDPHYAISTLVHASETKRRLPSDYLAELLGLSADRPINLYRFSCREARNMLLASPLIVSAEISRIKPSALLVRYTMREPVAKLGDRSNTAFDREGNLFPLSPFYHLEQLPIVYLGDSALHEETELHWGGRLHSRYAALAFLTLEQVAEQKVGSLVQMDLSHAFAPSCGERQLLLTFEEHDGEGSFSCLVRLTPKRAEQALAHYALLKGAFLRPAINRQWPTTVDLRLPQIAYISD